MPGSRSSWRGAGPFVRTPPGVLMGAGLKRLLVRLPGGRPTFDFGGAPASTYSQKYGARRSLARRGSAGGTQPAEHVTVVPPGHADSAGLRRAQAYQPPAATNFSFRASTIAEIQMPSLASSSPVPERLGMYLLPAWCSATSSQSWLNTGLPELPCSVGAR